MRLSVEECVYWLAVCFHDSWPSEHMVLRAMVAVVKRDVAALRLHRRTAATFAAPPTGRARGCQHRVALVTWALCRAAIRAIEAERSGRRSKAHTDGDNEGGALALVEKVGAGEESGR